MKKLNILLITTSLFIIGCDYDQNNKQKEEAPVVASTPTPPTDTNQSTDKDKAPIISIDLKENILDTQDLELTPRIQDDSKNLKYLWTDETNKSIGVDAKLKIFAPHKLGKHKYTITVTNNKNLSSYKTVEVTVSDLKFMIKNHGINVYEKDKPEEEYALEQITDDSFYALDKDAQYKVADKLLASFFFAYPVETLRSKIESGTFISDLKNNLKLDINSMRDIEDKIHNPERYYNRTDYYPQAIELSRFFEMKNLDKNYYDHWITYILTQTILFSPATELDTVANADGIGVYNRLYKFQKDGMGMRYTTFMHMQSDENWRRFRSPEDNGREMLEIYTLDTDDTHVPIVAQALKNWKLSLYHATLVIGLDENNESLSLNDDMNFTTGTDFYAALAQSNAFTKGVTSRLVDFMFSDSSTKKREEITNKIVSSNPNTWSDILKQIIFSKEYLFHMKKVKSMEETVFPLMKKFSYNSYFYSFTNLANSMKSSGQSSITYKLGRLQRVPLDDVSFATYQKYIRDKIFRNWSRDTKLSFNPHDVDETHNSDYFMSHYRNGYRSGISSKNFMTPEHYKFIADDVNQTDINYIQYIFNVVLNRDAKKDELAMFMNHLAGPDNTQWFASQLNYVNVDKNYQEFVRYQARYYIQYLVLEYILRLDELYFYQEIK